MTNFNKLYDETFDKYLSTTKYANYDDFLKRKMRASTRSQMVQMLNNTDAPLYYSVPKYDKMGTEPDKYEKILNYRNLIRNAFEKKEELNTIDRNNINELNELFKNNIGISDLYGKAAVAHMEKVFKKSEEDNFNEFIYNTRRDLNINGGETNNYSRDKLNQIFPEDIYDRQMWVDKNIEKYRKISQIALKNTLPDNKEDYMILYALSDPDFNKTVNFNIVKKFLNISNTEKEREFSKRSNNRQELLNIDPEDRFNEFNTSKRLDMLARQQKIGRLKLFDDYFEPSSWELRDRNSSPIPGYSGRLLEENAGFKN